MSDPAATPFPLTYEAHKPYFAGFGEDRPSRFARLLSVVRRLIDYGKELATTLQQHATANTDPTAVTRLFGTRDIALILARITRGLLCANALETRVVALAARPYTPPSPSRTPAQRTPRAPQPADAKPTEAADPRLANLPTAEQIADEIRRRPIGAVLADICRDLGIMPIHPMWRELRLVILQHGGSCANLSRDLFNRVYPIPSRSRSAAAPAASLALSPPAPAATGPP